MNVVRMRGLLAAALAMLASMAVCQAAFATKIVIHIYPGSLISLYPHLGIDQGFYKAEGLEASMLPLKWDIPFTDLSTQMCPI